MSLLKRLLATVSSLAILLGGGGVAGGTSPVSGDAPAKPSTALSQIAEAQAGQTIGNAALVREDVRGILDNAARTIELKDDVFFQEKIETGTDSALRAVFFDNTVLTLGPSSTAVLDSYIYDPNRGSGQMTLELVRGVFRFTSGTINDENYRIKTPVGVIGIRGTQLDIVILCVNADIDGCDVDEINFSLDVGSGRAEMELNSQTFSLEPGQRLSAPPAAVGGPVVEPVSALEPELPAIQVTKSVLREAALGLIEGLLPPNQTLATVNLDTLLEVGRTLLSANPAIADVVVGAVGSTRPNDVVDFASMASEVAPEWSDQVASAAAETLTTSEPTGEVDIQVAAGDIGADVTGDPDVDLY